MKMLRNVFFYLMPFLFNASLSVSQSLTNYSGLKNADLKKYTCAVEDIQKERQAELPGGGLPKWGPDQSKRKASSNPMIERVSILEDRCMQVKGEIYFNDFEGGKVTIVTLNNKGEEQKEIPAQIIPVNGTSGMLELDIKLPLSYSENFYLKSNLLRIVYSPSTHEKGKIYCFEFPKRWKVLPSNENIIVNVKPVPFKTAKYISNYSTSLQAPGTVPSQSSPNQTAQPTSPPSGSNANNKYREVLKDRKVTDINRSNKSTYPANSNKVNESYKTKIKIGEYVNAKPFTVVKANPNPVQNDMEPQGPSNQNQINLFKHIKSDYEFTRPVEISDIALDEIYVDKNPASGKFYCKPASYSLGWDAEEGHKFSMLYGNTNSSGEGQVNILASLNSNVTNNEFEFVRSTLASFLNGKSFTDLVVSEPTDAQATIKDNLARFNVPPDKCNVTIPSSIYDAINISMSATADATNFMITALKENSDIGGELTYKSDNEAVKYSIPLKLKIADKSTFGRFELDPQTWRENVWQNPTPFGVKLKNIHVFIMNSINGVSSPCIYTWNLGSPVVLSKSKVKFDSEFVPAWIDDPGKVLRMWMEYEVIPCEECTQEISDMLSSGTSSGRQKIVKFHSMGLLSSYGATFLKIKIRSKYFDPRGMATTEKTITINKDRQDFEVGPFYVWNEKDLNFEYKLSFLTDERTFEGTSWIGTKELEVFMNKNTAEKSMGANLPEQKK